MRIKERIGRWLGMSTGRMPSLQNDSAWEDYLSGNSGINAETALKVSAVFRCVDLISKTIASLPLHMYEETDNGKRIARNHALYEITHMLANRNTTAYEFWQMFATNLLLTRGAYAKIERDRNGKIIALWNIPTGCVSNDDINRINGERYIVCTLKYAGEEKTETLRDGDFVFVPNFRFSDDQNPLDPISIAGEVLGLTRDLSTYANATFRQGVNPGGVLEVPNALSDNAYTRLQEQFTQKYAGAVNAGKYIILEEGCKANNFERDLEKTQALESRKFAVSEICRVFGVPPHLCMDMEHATFSNIEQQSIEFVRDCIGPECVRIEQALFRDLLTQKERKKYYWKFNLNGLLRGDTAARTAFYNSMRQNGIMNADEIRELEDMNPLPNELGKTVYINGNMLPLENAITNAPRSARGGNNA